MPVTVNPETMIVSNTEAGSSLGLHMELGPDEVSVAQKPKDIDDVQMKNTIKKFKRKIRQINDNMHSHTLLGLMSAPEKTLLGLGTLPDISERGNTIVNGGHTVTGMVGNETLGETIRVGKDQVSYVHKPGDNKGNKAIYKGDIVSGMNGDEDLGETATVYGTKVNYQRKN